MSRIKLLNKTMLTKKKNAIFKDHPKPLINLRVENLDIKIDIIIENLNTIFTNLLSTSIHGYGGKKEKMS